MIPFSMRQRFGVRINQRHPLANDILAAYPYSDGQPGTIWECKSGRQYGQSVAASPAWTRNYDAGGSHLFMPQQNVASDVGFFNIGTSPLAGRATGSVSVEYYVAGTVDPSCVLGDDNSSDTNSTIEFFGYNTGAFWARSYIGGVQKTISGGSVVTGTWYFAVITYDGTAFALWINGKQIATTAASGSIASPGSSLCLGRRGIKSVSTSPYTLFGGMRNVVFYAKGLNEGDIANLNRDRLDIYEPLTPAVYARRSVAPDATKWFLAH